MMGSAAMSARVWLSPQSIAVPSKAPLTCMVTCRLLALHGHILGRSSHIVFSTAACSSAVAADAMLCSPCPNMNAWKANDTNASAGISIVRRGFVSSTAAYVSIIGLAARESHAPNIVSQLTAVTYAVGELVEFYTGS